MFPQMRTGITPRPATRRTARSARANACTKRVAHCQLSPDSHPLRSAYARPNLVPASYEARDSHLQPGMVALSHGKLPLWEQARRLAYEAGATPIPAETMPIGPQADNRVLARPVVAVADLPSTATSAMDGWAVCGDGPWLIIGSALAGNPFGKPLAPQTAIRIATGAQTPSHASAVVRSEAGAEQHRAGQDWLESDSPDPRFIRPAALECRAGTELAPSGTVVTPALIGVMAAAGLDAVPVRQLPRVAVVIFGDELLSKGPPRNGRVRDSLGPQLGAWIQRLGGVAQPPAFVPDIASAHVAAIASAMATADLVVTTGGTAAGPLDHLHAAVRELGGAFVVDSAAIRPGHPMLLAQLPVPDAAEPQAATALLGLPGNPQSALIALMTLGQPVLSQLLGQDLPKTSVVLAGEHMPAPPAENRLIPGCLDQNVFTPSEYLGSAMLRGVAAATGFAIVEPGGVAAGAQMGWLPFP